VALHVGLIVRFVQPNGVALGTRNNTQLSAHPALAFQGRGCCWTLAASSCVSSIICLVLIYGVALGTRSWLQL
jgi:hypothetical protein